MEEPEKIFLNQAETLRNLAYLRGFIDGLTAYAWSKDGQQFVGTCGTTLKEAINGAEKTWNFRP